jgi:hypothetical protein
MLAETVNDCKKMLWAMSEETQHGPLEIFICGGYRPDTMYHKLIGMIEEFNQENSEEAEILDDRFGLMELSELHLIDKRDQAFPGSRAISYAGFDQNGNPYAVMSVKFPDFTGSVEDIQNYIWKEDDAFISFDPED